jgi:hypothetical protein
MANPPQVPRPGVSLPQGPPPPPNRALWWVLGAIIALLLLIIGGGLYMASRIVRGITVKGPNQVELHTPGGEINIRKTSQDNTGLPVYPGSVRRPDGAQVQIEPLHKEGGFGLSAATYTAPASLDTVTGWYRQRLDPTFKEQRGKATVNIGHIDVQHADLAFVSQQEDRLRIVALEHEGDQTKITLVRMGKREPQ